MFFIPIPTWASWIIETSFAPSPMAAVIGFDENPFTTFTTYAESKLMTGCLINLVDFTYFCFLYGRHATADNRITMTANFRQKLPMLFQ